MAASACSKTIITTNPDSREAHALAQYAQNVELTENDTAKTFVPGESTVDLSSIVAVCSIHDVKMRLDGAGKKQDAEHVIVYAIITSLDLDRDEQSGVKVRCGKCRFRMDPHLGMCTNKDCSQGINTDVVPEVMDTDVLFDLRISVTDYTGTMDGCILSGSVAENMLNCKVEDFLSMTEDEKTHIKWKYLLERCKIYLKLSRSSKAEGRAFVKVVGCEIADLREVASNG